MSGDVLLLMGYLNGMSNGSTQCRAKLLGVASFPTNSRMLSVVEHFEDFKPGEEA